jgi:hypothetical protein
MSSGSSGTNVKSIRVMRRKNAQERRICSSATSRKVSYRSSSMQSTPSHMPSTISSGRSVGNTAASACNPFSPSLATKCFDSFTMSRSKGHRELKLGSTRTAMPLATTTFINTRRTTRNTITFRSEHGGRGEWVKVATCEEKMLFR